MAKTALDIVRGAIHTNAKTLAQAIEDLVSAIGSGGSGGIPADGSVTTAKLADGAVTSDKLAYGAVTPDKVEDSTISNIANELEERFGLPKLYATDEATQSVLQSLNLSSTVIYPSDSWANVVMLSPASRLCWISQPNGVLEVSTISFLGNLQTNAVVCYAKGHFSSASGTIGIDDSWTIENLS